MEVVAITRNLRMSSRKVRLVADVVRGMDAVKAESQLRFIPKAASLPIEKLLKSALANAEHNFRLGKDSLFVKAITVDQGAVLKRWRARAFGRAAPIHKHSCHITLTLAVKTGMEGRGGTAKSSPGDTSSAKGDAKHLNTPGKETVTKDMKEGHAPEVVDTRRMGKHRHAQNVDRIQKKESGGGPKRLFSRKAG